MRKTKRVKKLEMIWDIIEVLPSPLDEQYFQILKQMSFSEVRFRWMNIFKTN